MYRTISVFTVALLALLLGTGIAMAYDFGDTHVVDGELIIYVQGGIPTKNLYYLADPWVTKDGYLEGSGMGNDVFTTQIVAGGDFHVKARISIPVNVNEKGEGSGATFCMDMQNNRIGFAGYREPWRMFAGSNANGEIFPTGDKDIGKSMTDFGFPDVKHIEEPFLWEVVRKGDEITFYINGQEVYRIEFPNNKIIGKMGFHPWRGTMRIYEWAFKGTILDLSF